MIGTVSPKYNELQFYYNYQLLCHLQGFPMIGLLWADLTSIGSSFTLLLAKLLYHTPFGTPLELSSSQYILDKCHGLITPLTHYNLTNTIALLGFRWRYKLCQSDLIFIGAIPALQRHAFSIAFMILCVRFTYLFT